MCLALLASINHVFKSRLVTEKTNTEVHSDPLSVTPAVESGYSERVYILLLTTLNITPIPFNRFTISS